MIRFIYLCSIIFLAQERGKLCFKIDDLDATKCNYGKHEMDNFRWCDCKNVLGKGTKCQIKKLFNSTHIQVLFAIVPDHLDSWKKNLETQFTKEMITIVQETKYYVKGFVNNSIYFQLHLLPSISDKKDFLTLRSNFEMIEKILYKEVEMKTVSTKEDIRKSEKTRITNETKVVKNDSFYFYCTWMLVVILFLIILGSIIRYRKNIKKYICLPTVNRLKSKISRKADDELPLLEEFLEISDIMEWKGRRPIHFACQNGNFDIVNLLIAKGCDIERQDKMGRRPIHFACKVGHIDIVNLLIAKGCNIEREDKMGSGPIHIACENGHVDIVNLLIAKGCDIDSRDIMGSGPIHIACKNSHVDIVNLLITKGCKIDSKDNMGNRPIHFAYENGNIDIMNLLIDKGCDIDSNDKKGSRLVDFAFKIFQIERGKC